MLCAVLEMADVQGDDEHHTKMRFLAGKLLPLLLAELEHTQGCGGGV